jgi:endogenous inhibitor of DNA gyrase (YacG/DUF329 family)
MSKTIKCPTCGKPSVFEPSNKFRPFCSERCQLLDLGRWADEKYSVPGESVDPHTEVMKIQIAAKTTAIPPPRRYCIKRKSNAQK